jgi:hypothetical protein
MRRRFSVQKEFYGILYLSRYEYRIIKKSLSYMEAVVIFTPDE